MPNLFEADSTKKRTPPATPLNPEDDPLNPENDLSAGVPDVPHAPGRVVKPSADKIDEIRQINPDFADTAQGFIDFARERGVNDVIIKSGYRTAERQNWLHTHGYPTKGNDGFKRVSPHQQGRAVDFSTQNPANKAVMQTLLAAYARKRKLHIPGDEPWHLAGPPPKGVTSSSKLNLQAEDDLTAGNGHSAPEDDLMESTPAPTLPTRLTKRQQAQAAMQKSAPTPPGQAKLPLTPVEQRLAQGDLAGAAAIARDQTFAREAAGPQAPAVEAPFVEPGVGEARPLDLETGGMTPQDRAYITAQQQKYNQIDTVSNIAYARLAQQRIEAAQRRQAEARRQQARAAMEGGPKVTTNDAAWHMGLSPSEAQRLSPRAYQVLSAAVAEDERKRAAGPLPPPSLEYQNQMRAKAGLKPLQYNVPTAPSAVAPYYQAEVGTLPVETPTTQRGGFTLHAPTLAEQMSEAKRTAPTPSEEQSIKAAIRQQIAKEIAEREANASMGTEAQLLAQRSRQEGLNLPDVEAEVNKRYAAYQRSTAPEMIAARKEMGRVGAVSRTLTVPPQKFAADVISMAGGVAGLGGLTPNRVSDYLNTRAQFLTESAQLPPLTPTGEVIERGLPEKVSTALLDLGLTVFEVAALKKASGLSMGKVMALETALKTSDQPLPDRAMQVAQSYALGKILDQHLSRKASAALFGAPTGLESYAQYKEGGMSLEDAVLQTGVQAGAGFILGGKGPKELPQKVAEVGARAETTPEWLRTRLAKPGGLGQVVLVEELPSGSPGLALTKQGERQTGPNANVGRVLSVYGDPKSEGIGGVELSGPEAVEAYAKRGVQVVKVSPAEYDQALARINAVNPTPPAEIAPPAPSQPQIAETSARRPPQQRSVEEMRAVDTAREQREAKETRATQPAVEPPPEITKTRALDAIDRANKANDGEAVKLLIATAREKGATTEEINEALRRATGAVTPPTPETPRVEEKPGTLVAQFESMMEGRGNRKATILPANTPSAVTAATAPLPPGVDRVIASNGDVVVFKTSVIDKDEVKKLLRTGRSNDLTGLPNPEGPEATVVGVARVAEGPNKGEERLAGYIVPGNEDKFRKEAIAQFPGETLSFEFGGKKTEEKVIEQRTSPAPEVKQEQKPTTVESETPPQPATYPGAAEVAASTPTKLPEAATTTASTSATTAPAPSVLDKRVFEVPFKQLEGRFTRDEQRASVEWALKNGEQVPAEVLADYPDLVPAAQPSVTPPAELKTQPSATESQLSPEAQRLSDLADANERRLENAIKAGRDPASPAVIAERKNIQTLRRRAADLSQITTPKEVSDVTQEAAVKAEALKPISLPAPGQATVPDKVKVFRGSTGTEEESRSGVTFFTPDKDYATKYGPNVREVELDTSNFFDTRKPEHRKILEDINNERRGDYAVASIHPIDGVPFYSDESALKDALRNRGHKFDGIVLTDWTARGSGGIVYAKYKTSGERTLKTPSIEAQPPSKAPEAPSKPSSAVQEPIRERRTTERRVSSQPSETTDERRTGTRRVGPERRSPSRIPEADWLEIPPEEREKIRAQLETEMGPPTAQEGQPLSTEPLVTHEAPKQRDYVDFPAEMGSLGIRRAAMPQIKSEHRGALANRLKARGIDYSFEEVLPGDLKPSQAEYSPGKVERARGWTGPERKLLVSSEGFVLDGHHQWKQKLEDFPNVPIPIIRLQAPAQEALLELAQFPSSDVQGTHGEYEPDMKGVEAPATPGQSTTSPETKEESHNVHREPDGARPTRGDAERQTKEEAAKEESQKAAPVAGVSQQQEIIRETPPGLSPEAFHRHIGTVPWRALTNRAKRRAYDDAIASGDFSGPGATYDEFAAGVSGEDWLPNGIQAPGYREYVDYHEREAKDAGTRTIQPEGRPPDRTHQGDREEARPVGQRGGAPGVRPRTKPAERETTGAQPAVAPVPELEELSADQIAAMFDEAVADVAKQEKGEDVTATLAEWATRLRQIVSGLRGKTPTGERRQQLEQLLNEGQRYREQAGVHDNAKFNEALDSLADALGVEIPQAEEKPVETPTKATRASEQPQGGAVAEKPVSPETPKKAAPFMREAEVGPEVTASKVQKAYSIPDDEWERILRTGMRDKWFARYRQEHPSGKLPAQLAKRLLALPNELRASPSGPSNKSLRREIYFTLTGEKATDKNSGSGAITKLLLSHYGISTEGKAPVEYEEEIVAKLRETAGLPAEPSRKQQREAEQRQAAIAARQKQAKEAGELDEPELPISEADVDSMESIKATGKASRGNVTVRVINMDGLFGVETQIGAVRQRPLPGTGKPLDQAEVEAVERLNARAPLTQESMLATFNEIDDASWDESTAGTEAWELWQTIPGDADHEFTQQEGLKMVKILKAIKAGEEKRNQPTADEVRDKVTADLIKLYTDPKTLPHWTEMIAEQGPAYAFERLRRNVSDFILNFKDPTNAFEGDDAKSYNEHIDDVTQLVLDAIIRKSPPPITATQDVKPREPAREKAIGVITGSKVDRLEAKGWTIAYGDVGTGDRYYDVVGVVSGGPAGRFREAGLTILYPAEAANLRKANEPTPAPPVAAPVEGDTYDRALAAYKRLAPAMAEKVLIGNAERLTDIIEKKKPFDPNGMLREANKVSRTVFSEITGVKLGATDKSAREAIESWKQGTPDLAELQSRQVRGEVPTLAQRIRDEVLNTDAVKNVFDNQSDQTQTILIELESQIKKAMGHAITESGITPLDTAWYNKVNVPNFAKTIYVYAQEKGLVAPNEDFLKPAPPPAKAPTPAPEPEGKYRVDFQGAGDTRWASNAKRFATPAEADEYGNDLLMRWTGAKEYRVVPADTPEREEVTPEQLRDHASAQALEFTEAPVTAPAKPSLASATKALGDIFDEEEEEPGGTAQFSRTEPEFDEAKYAMAEPQFVIALQSFQDEGLTLAQSIPRLVKYLNTEAGYSAPKIARMKPYVVRFALNVQAGKVDLSETQAEATTLLAPTAPTGIESLAQAVTERLNKVVGTGSGMNNAQLRDMAERAFGGTVAQGTYTVKDAYDALELGVNRYLLERAPGMLAGNSQQALRDLRVVMSALPRQTDRTTETDQLQQFSTPPTLAFIAAKALNIRATDVVEEPSAGTGNLALWAKAAGATVETNEISPRRRKILEAMGFSPTSVDAELLNDLLPLNIRPTAILMNPPFSATGGRTASNDTKYGARHIEQALLRLEDGGRAVIITGEGMAIGKHKFSDWWKRMMTRYNVRANLSIPGDEYGKYGTTFGTQLLVIDKTGPTPGTSPSEQLKNVRFGDVTSLEVALNELAPIIADRSALKPNATRSLVAADRGDVRGDLGEPAPAPERGGELPGSGRSGPVTGENGPSGPDESDTGVREGKPGTRPTKPQRSRPVRSGGRGVEDVRLTDGLTGTAEPDFVPTDLGLVYSRRTEKRETEEGGTFVSYSPAKLAGAVVHPADIVESASMAAVEPPDITHIPKLPAAVVTEGKLSDLQLESVSYAGQRFKQRLPSGARAGYFIGDGCVARGTRIFNPITGQHTPIEDLVGKSHTVLSLTDRGFEPREAVETFRKGIADLYRVVLDDGRSIVVTDEHRFLTPTGWITLRQQLSVGDVLCSAEGTGANGAATRSASGKRDQGITLGCLHRYAAGCRQDDGLPLPALGIGRSFVPSLSDALERIHPLTQTDGLDISLERSPLLLDGCHPSRSSSSPSWIPCHVSIVDQADGRRAQPLGGKRLTRRLFPVERSGLRCSFESVDLYPNRWPGAGLPPRVHEVRRPSDAETSSPLYESRCSDGQSAPSRVQIGKHLILEGRRFQESLRGASSQPYSSMWRYIVSIEFVRRDEFFDMFVPGPENYVAEGFVNHNTGVGKGREVSGIILDEWNQGNRRALWLSVSRDLIEDASRDLKDIGAGHIPLSSVSDFPPAEDVTLPKGVIFSTYNSLISAAKTGNKQKRREQIEKWLGEDGVIILDEAHKAKNALGQGQSEPTQTGQAVIDLQANLPNARVVYASATGATDVRNMAYMTRLGLWGPGTSFPGGFIEFMGEIDRGGVGAMEMVSRDMKALGMYASRSISFNGVDYQETIHELTPEQRHIYDTAANAMQVVLQNIKEALGITNASKRAQMMAMQRFWADHQRLFRQLISSFKVPTVIKQTEKALADGKSVVIGLIGTGESRTKEQVTKALSVGGNLEDLDFSPREFIANMIDKAFPVNVYQEVTDEETGQTTVELVRDEAGNPVVSQEALRLKEAMLDQLSDLHLPENPLDQVVNHFGERQVAEMTGRKRRLMRGPDGKMAYKKRAPDGVAMTRVNVHENKQFQSGKKRIAIISDAAATGISLHASNREENKQRRVHMTLELGWSADKQMQTFGRTHRSDQSIPPEYDLISTDIGGEKRFSSTIARRLASLGALTKGQRDATGGGDLAKYNFETEEGKAALSRFYGNIMSGQSVEGVENPRQALKDMGILKDRTDGESISDDDMVDVPRFLNRILALDLDRQNVLFNQFTTIFEQTIDFAKENGTFDEGVADVKGESIRMKGEPSVVHRDQTTGAETTHYLLDVDTKTEPVEWDRAKLLASREKAGFYKQNRSGNVIVADEAASHTDPATGFVFKTYAVTTPLQERDHFIRDSELSEKYSEIRAAEAKSWWLDAFNKVPQIKTTETHVIGGAILPLWQRLKTDEGARLKVVRVMTDDGQRVVGIQIPNKQVASVLRSIGVGRELKTPEEVFTAVLDQDDVVKLVGGLVLAKARLHNDDAIEIRGADYNKFEQLRQMGLINERIDWKQRFFVPTNTETGIPALRMLLGSYPVVDMRSEGKPVDADVNPQFSDAPDATDTEAFQRWFGTSKVVDENGQPLIVYHFTTKEAEKGILESGFTTSKPRARLSDEGVPDGIFFTPQAEGVFSDQMEFARLPVYLKMESPLRMDNRAELIAWGSERDPEYARLTRSLARYTDLAVYGELFRRMQSGDEATRQQAEQEHKTLVDTASAARKRLTNLIKSEGHDGVIMERDEGGPQVTQTYVVLEPTQIKSASSNRGTFDPNDPNILFATGWETAEAGPPEEPEFTVEGNHIALNEAGRVLVSDAYRLTSFKYKMPARGVGGVYEKNPAALVSALERLAEQEPDRAEASRKLAGIVREVGADAGTVSLAYGEPQRRHEGIHRTSHTASGDPVLAGRHTPEGFQRLESHPAWSTIKETLLQKHYTDDLPTLVEEAFAYLATGNNLGLTDEEADSFIEAWLRSFKQKNGSPSIAKFKELSDGAEQARQRIYADSEAVDRRAGGGVPGVSDQGAEGTPGAHEESARGEPWQKPRAASGLTENEHRLAVAQAINTGKDVPGTVLEEYPGLAESIRFERAQFAGAPLQTESKAFRSWFGDSKVVDGVGDPKVVFHGTTSSTEIEAFTVKEDGAIFFAESPDEAARYADPSLQPPDFSSMYSAYLSVQNPHRLNDYKGTSLSYLVEGGLFTKEQSAHMLNMPFNEFAEVYSQTARLLLNKVDREDLRLYHITDNPPFIQWLKRNGYDGFTALEGGERLWGVLKPTQIKSATGNRGAFDPHDPNVLFAEHEDPWARLLKLAEDIQRPEGKKSRQLPKTFEAAEMETGTSLFYTPSTVSTGIEMGKQTVVEKGIDGAIEFVKTGDGIGWASTGYEVLAQLRADEQRLRPTDAQAADAVADKRLKFLDEFVERSTELGRAIVGIKAIEMFAPDRAAYHLNKLSQKRRKHGISKEEEAAINEMSLELARINDELRAAQSQIDYRIEVARALEEDLAAAESRARRREKYQPGEGKERQPRAAQPYEVELNEQAADIKDDLIARLGSLDFGNLKVESRFPGQAGKVGPIKPLPGDAELLAQYTASRLATYDTVADLNKHLLDTFGLEVEPYLSSIRKRAFQIRKDARLAELANRETSEKRSRTILGEIQKEIATEAKAVKDLERAHVTAEKERKKAEKAATQEAERSAQRAERAETKAGEKGLREEARKQAKAAREQEREARLAEIKSARARLKETRKEYQEASEAETKGWRATNKAQREAARTAGLWDTPIRRAAEEARARLATATDVRDPLVMEDLAAVAAAKFIPDKPGGPVRKKAVFPSKVRLELIDEFPHLVTKKNVDEVYKRGYQRILDMEAAAREAARLRAASKESQQLWEKMGVDTEAQALLIQRATKRRQQQELRHKMAEEFERVSRSRTANFFFELNAFPRSAKSSIDAPELRQGMFAFLTHPQAMFRTLTAAGKGYAAIHPADYHALVEELQRMPRYELAKTAGMDLPEIIGDVSDPRVHSEEYFQSGWGQKVPHIRVSEQAYVLSMNTKRMTLFNLLAPAGEAHGYTWENNPEFFRQVASFINDVTGRGNVPESMARFMSTWLNWFFFAPRYNVSKIQLLNDLFNPLKYISAEWAPETPGLKQLSGVVKELQGGLPGSSAYDPIMRKIAAEHVIRWFGALLALLLVAKLLGFSITFDPEDADAFPKIRWGNTSYDFSGGEIGTVRFLYRFLKGIAKLATGRHVSDFENPYEIALGKRGFFRQKLSPWAGGFVDWIVGTDAVGQPATISSPVGWYKQGAVKTLQEDILVKMIEPIVVGDFLDGATDSGWLGVARTAPALLGLGVQTYPRKEKPSSTQKIIYEKLAEQREQTPQEKERTQLMRKLEEDIRQGKPVTAQIEAAVKEGKLRPDDRTEIVRSAHLTPTQLAFKQLGIVAAMDVYADPALPAADKAALKELLINKGSMIENLPEPEQDAAEARFESLTGEKPKTRRQQRRESGRKRSPRWFEQLKRSENASPSPTP